MKKRTNYQLPTLIELLNNNSCRPMVAIIGTSYITIILSNLHEFESLPLLVQFSIVSIVTAVCMLLLFNDLKN